MVAASSTQSSSAYATIYTGTTGLISSPNYPQPYPDYIYEYYEIHASGLTNIKLQFLEFDIYGFNTAGGCTTYNGDILEVRVHVSVRTSHVYFSSSSLSSYHRQHHHHHHRKRSKQF